MDQEISCRGSGPGFITLGSAEQPRNWRPLHRIRWCRSDTSDHPPPWCPLGASWRWSPCCGDK